MELTKKERKQTYLKVANELLTHNCFVCVRLAHLAGTDVNYEFEEFSLFEPDRKEREGAVAWWYITDRESRINALLLCAEMCN